MNDKCTYFDYTRRSVNKYLGKRNRRRLKEQADRGYGEGGSEVGDDLG